LCHALAAAFGVRRSAVTVVRGATGRHKIVDIDIDPAEGERLLGELLGP
jgi:uncharacterized protein YggU (UPF0235/DUF167 family)